MPDWTWDSLRAVYRSSEGDVLNEDDLRQLRDEFADNLDGVVAGIMALLYAKTDTDTTTLDTTKVAMWETKMRLLLQDAILAFYLLGRGGTMAMSQSDWNRAGNMIRNLYSYLSGFAQDLTNGALSVESAAARAAMYTGAGVYAYERGRQAAFGLGYLPGYPGQGTSCLSNCRCSWEIKKYADRWEASWRLEPGAKHCKECQDRGIAWARVIIPRS